MGAHREQAEDRYEGEITVLPHRRLQTIDHTVRNSAETINGVAYNLQHLANSVDPKQFADISDKLQSVASEFSGERRAMAGDREKIRGLESGVRALKADVKKNHEETAKMVGRVEKIVGIGVGLGGALAVLKAIEWAAHH